jgi:arylsulfatase
MPAFDPIASPAVRSAAHREPAFVFPEQAAAARRRLAEFAARTGRRPNILVILFDDVGWGDFGCYGGGAAVGAPTPTIDGLARRGLLLALASHPAHGPAAPPARAPAAAHVRRGRRPPG